MPQVLESGKLRLATDEVTAFELAASRLLQSCEGAVDLAQPLDVQQWMLLQVTQAALESDLEPLDRIIAAIETSIRARAKRH